MHRGPKVLRGDIALELAVRFEVAEDLLHFETRLFGRRHDLLQFGRHAHIGIVVHEFREVDGPAHAKPFGRLQALLLLGRVVFGLLPFFFFRVDLDLLLREARLAALGRRHRAFFRGQPRYAMPEITGSPCSTGGFRMMSKAARGSRGWSPFPSFARALLRCAPGRARYLGLTDT